MGCAKKPPLSGEVARRNAETERLQQICGNLSVSLRLTAPLQGEPWMVHIPQAPFTQGSLGVVVVQGTENDCCFLGQGAA